MHRANKPVFVHSIEFGCHAVFKGSEANQRHVVIVDDVIFVLVQHTLQYLFLEEGANLVPQAKAQCKLGENRGRRAWVWKTTSA